MLIKLLLKLQCSPMKLLLSLRLHSEKFLYHYTPHSNESLQIQFALSTQVMYIIQVYIIMIRSDMARLLHHT